MDKVNRTEAIVHNITDVPIDGDMQYYIDYASKMLYPSDIAIQEIEFGEDGYVKMITVESHSFIDRDSFMYMVDFDWHGKFILGNAKFADKPLLDDIFDQNKFKQILKKDINKLNCLHRTINGLLTNRFV